MNYTTARCGHAVSAVGAPSSEARWLVEKNLCPRCREAVAFVVYPWRGAMTEYSSMVFHEWIDAEVQAMEWDENAPDGEASEIVPLFSDPDLSPITVKGQT